MSILENRAPERRAENDRPGTLFGIALAAFLAYWVVTSAMYQVLTGHKLMPASQPATQSVVEIPPHDLVALSIASSMILLPLTRAVVSIASRSGMPALSNTLRVRQARAMIALRISAPNIGNRSLAASNSRRPASVWTVMKKSTTS